MLLRRQERAHGCLAKTVEKPASLPHRSGGSGRELKDVDCLHHLFWPNKAEWVDGEMRVSYNHGLITARRGSPIKKTQPVENIGKNPCLMREKENLDELLTVVTQGVGHRRGDRAIFLKNLVEA